VSPDGQTVYVLDTAHGLQYFDATGTYQGQWGGPGKSEVRLTFPTGVTVGPDGTVYVTEDRENTVKVFAPDGTYLGYWGSESGSVSTAQGEFWNPYDVAVAPNGTTGYVADTNNHRIQAFALPSCRNAGEPRATPAVSSSPTANHLAPLTAPHALSAAFLSVV
jgi:sugar lactone lactonase YvrE